MYCMLLNWRTHIPATTQSALLCLLSLVTEPCVSGVKAYGCVIRSIPLSPPSLITQIEMQIRKQFMFICLCSTARHTAHTSVSFRKTALTYSVLLNPMCLNQALWVNPLCATAEFSRPELKLQWCNRRRLNYMIYLIHETGTSFLDLILTDSQLGNALTLTVRSASECFSGRLTQASNEKAMWVADWEQLMFVLPLTIIWSYLEWPHRAGSAVMLIKLFDFDLNQTDIEERERTERPKKKKALSRSVIIQTRIVYLCVCSLVTVYVPLLVLIA